MRRCALAALLVLAAPVAAAGAQEPAITQHVFDADGHPRLIANPSPMGGLGIVWAVCRPDDSICTPAGVGAAFAPGPVPAGTSFEATVDGVVVRSRPWRGAVIALAAPGLSGPATVGARVQLRPGRWTGGWGGESDELRLQACRTQAGEGCETASFPGDGPDSVTVAARHVGRFLFAVAERVPRDRVRPAIGYPRPRDVPPLAAGATVAVSPPLGPVAGEPSAQLRPRARLRAGRPVLGTVSCPVRCDVTVRLRSGSAVLHHRRAVRGGTRRLAVPGVRAGRWGVVVRVDGRRLAAATVRVVA